MTVAASTLNVQAVVDACEHDAVLAAFGQLERYLEAACGATWRCHVRFLDALTDVKPDPQGIVIASLLTEFGRAGFSADDIEARWRKGLHALADGKSAALFVVTIFRHIKQGPTGVSASQLHAMRGRIRRLNRFATELSVDTGASIVDLDRALAHRGARALGADMRLESKVAAKAVADVIVSALLAEGLGHIVGVDESAAAADQHAKNLLAERNHPGSVSMPNAPTVDLLGPQKQSFHFLEAPSRRLILSSVSDIRSGGYSIRQKITRVLEIVRNIDSNDVLAMAGRRFRRRFSGRKNKGG